MSRGESYGGGQSSLGYLFGSDEKQKNTAPIASPIVYAPPFGIDTNEDKPPENIRNTDKKSIRGDNQGQAQSQNLGIFPTGRPSTKVNSVPGGDSSLGYLFGDK